MNKKQHGLGKGLSALIEKGDYSQKDSPYREDFDIERVSPNPYQPRMQIDPKELVDIAASIREHGVIQPLIVTKNPDGNNYYIIAGERRYRASKLAGLKTIPVVIKESSPQEMLELALIENIQREDLNPLEEATAFKQLQDQFGLTQTDIAHKMGLNRVTITNKIRLLNLPPEIQEYVLNQGLSEGHARALLGITDNASRIAAANIVMKKNLSVRETEELVRKINFGKKKSQNIKIEYSNRTKDYLVKISQKLGYTTRIQKMAKGGKVTVRFQNNEELEDLLSKMADHKNLTKPKPKRKTRKKRIGNNN